MGDDDLVEGGEGVASPGHQHPEVVGQQTIFAPRESLRETLLHVRGGVPVAVDTRPPATGIHGQPLGRLAEAARFDMAVVAGQVDGEAPRQETCDHRFHLPAIPFQPDVQRRLEVRCPQRSIVYHIINLVDDQAQGAGAGAVHLRRRLVPLQRQVDVRAGIRRQALPGPEDRPAAIPVLASGLISTSILAILGISET